MAEKLDGKDLVVEDAADMLPGIQKELEQLMLQDDAMRVILVDNPKQMEHLCKENPTLTNKFQYVVQQPLSSGEMPAASVLPTAPIAPVEPEPSAKVVRKEASAAAKPIQAQNDDEELDIDEFAQYACQYAAEIDCSITGKSMLALYERIEIMEEDGIPLTRMAAEDLIEEAADKAEKPSFGKLIKGAFSSKYDKDGLLILKEEHFI